MHWPLQAPDRKHEDLTGLKDPGGNLIEIYARLTSAELAQMPEDKEPVFLMGAP